MASAQPPHQEGGLPSKLMPTAPPPPPPAPERTQPQRRGQTRSALQSHMVGIELSQQWVEEGPRTHSEGLLQV